MNNINPYRSTAKVVGVIYLAGMVIGIGGNMLIQSILGTPDHLSAISPNSMKLSIGAMLWLMTVGGDAAHGVLMFPVLKQHNEGLAVGYLGFRIIDAVFIGVHVLFVLLQIPIGNEYQKAGIHDTFSLQTLSTVFLMVNLYAYQIGMIFVGFAGLILCYSFFRSKVVPQFLAVWGIAGYVTILCGSVLEVLGFDLHLIHTIPGGLWELFTGVWLIVKGFNSSEIILTSSKTVIKES
jgi:hypothetical protein